MTWLWLVGTGNSDVQMQVCVPDAEGRGLTQRMELVRRGAVAMQTIREQHQALFALAIAGKLSYPVHERLPDQVRRDQSRPDGLFFDRDGSGQVSTCELVQAVHLRFGLKLNRLVLNFATDRLDVLCPKVEPLLPVLLEDLKQQKLKKNDGVVVVLNTCRDDDPDEPMASGPVVAQMIATRLELPWESNAAQEGPSRSGRALWIDILKGSETCEANEQQIIARIVAGFSLVDATRAKRVYITPSGGFPKLKSLYPILAARRFGRRRVFVLEDPEQRRGGKLACVPLGTSAFEQEALRLQAVEQIDQGHWLAAYGVARAALTTQPKTRWALELLRLVAPIYGMATTESSPLSDMARLALRAEAELTLGNLPQAVLQIGALVESLIRVAAQEHVRVQLGLTPTDDGRSFKAQDQRAAQLIADDYPKMLEPIRWSTCLLDVRTTASLLLPWTKKIGDASLEALATAYAPLARYRNTFAHDDYPGKEISRARKAFVAKGLIATRGAFGANLVGTPLFAALLQRTELSQLPNFLGELNELNRSLREDA